MSHIERHLLPWSVAVWLLASSVCAANAGTQPCFFQDFSSSATLGDYVGTKANQFDGLTAMNGTSSTFKWSLVPDTSGTSNALLGTKSATYPSGAITRSTDLPTVGGAIYQFSMKVISPVSAQTTTAISFQVGTGFDTSTTVADSTNTHSQFAVNLNSDGTCVFRNPDPITGINGPGAFSGTENVFFVVNNTGGSLKYTGPNGTSQTVGDDKWDLWVGTSQQFDEVAAVSVNVNPTDFKLTWSGGNGSIQFDNFSVTPVPEPGTVCGGLLLVGAAAWHCRRWRRDSSARLA